MEIPIGKILFGMLFLVCAAEDIKKKQVHRMLLILMAALMVLDFAFDHEVSVGMRFAGIFLGSLFLLVSRLTRKQIGKGDGILLTIVGGYLGMFAFIEFIMYAFFMAALAAIVLLAIRKFNRKRTMPLIPFLFAGFIVCQWIGG